MFVWTIGDAIGLLILGVFGFFAICIQISTWYREFRCKHDGEVKETQACDAICSKCGKNLGFIGSWREAKGKSINV